MNHPFNDPGLASPDAPDYSAESAIAVLKEHIPSITDDDERVMGSLNVFDEQFDYADYALRTCHCGVKIEGYYEYVDHLEEVFRGAG
jgi:hypothetical protein